MAPLPLHRIVDDSISWSEPTILASAVVSVSLMLLIVACGCIKKNGDKKKRKPKGKRVDKADMIVIVLDTPMEEDKKKKKKGKKRRKDKKEKKGSDEEGSSSSSENDKKEVEGTGSTKSGKKSKKLVWSKSLLGKLDDIEREREAKAEAIKAAKAGQKSGKKKGKSKGVKSPPGDVVTESSTRTQEVKKQPETKASIAQSLQSTDMSTARPDSEEGAATQQVPKSVAIQSAAVQSASPPAQSRGIEKSAAP